MASIYKRPEAETWQCQYYVKDPSTGEIRKVRKSTSCKTKDEARIIAAEMEIKAREVMRAGSFQAQVVQAILAKAAIDIKRETFTGPSAHKCAAELYKAATGEELITFTIETWSAEWLKRKDRGIAKTMARYRGHVTAFLDWLGDERRKKPLETVTTQDVRNWQLSLKAAGRTGKTVLSYVKDIGGMFRAAISDGIASYNPCGTVIPEIGTEDSMERKPFNMDEIKTLMKASPSAEWRGLILVAAYTGLRLGDAAHLLWGKVDIENQLITLIPSKTKKKKRVVRIPIQIDLLEYLKAVPRDKRSPNTPVLPTLAKMTVHGAAGLSNSFTGIMMNAGVSRGEASRVIAEGETIGKGRITHERGFHSLRHTFNSWLLNAGVSEEDRMALTGQSTRQANQIYSHFAEAKLRDAIGKLPGLTKKAKKATAGDHSTSEISNIAARLPTGSPEERAENARLILEAVKKKGEPPPTIKAWHETTPLEELLDELMPYESTADRTARYQAFLKWHEHDCLKNELDGHQRDSVQFGTRSPAVKITEKMVIDRADRTLKQHIADGVQQAEAMGQLFRRWNAANPKTEVSNMC